MKGGAVVVAYLWCYIVCVVVVEESRDKSSRVSAADGSPSSSCRRSTHPMADVPEHLAHHDATLRRLTAMDSPDSGLSDYAYMRP